MKKSLAKLFDGGDDLEFCAEVFKFIFDSCGERSTMPDVSQLPEPARVVLLTWRAEEILSTGFSSLFAGTFHGDPDYLLTLKAFQLVGHEAKARAFGRALDLFPDGKAPVDVRKRLFQYRSAEGRLRGEIDRQFWDESNELEGHLAKYIRKNRSTFENLAIAKSNKKDRHAEQTTSDSKRPDPIAGQIIALPHWARIAFAAHCADLVFPFYRTLWPNARPKRAEDVEYAIRTVKSAAAKGKVIDELKKAHEGAVMATGAARVSDLQIVKTNEPPPPDGNAAFRVTLISIAVQLAAEAAETKPKTSAYYAYRSYASARDLAAELKPELVDEMARDLEALQRAAQRGKWTDKSPVPDLSIRATGDGNGPKRPWWKLW
jgi:hypothetical protein